MQRTGDNALEVLLEASGLSWVLTIYENFISILQVQKRRSGNFKAHILKYIRYVSYWNQWTPYNLISLPSLTEVLHLISLRPRCETSTSFPDSRRKKIFFKINEWIESYRHALLEKTVEVWFIIWWNARCRSTSVTGAFTLAQIYCAKKYFEQFFILIQTTFIWNNVIYSWSQVLRVFCCCCCCVVLFK